MLFYCYGLFVSLFVDRILPFTPHMNYSQFSGFGLPTVGITAYVTNAWTLQSFGNIRITTHIQDLGDFALNIPNAPNFYSFCRRVSEGKTGSHSVAQAGLEFIAILLPQLPKHRDYSELP